MYISWDEFCCKNEIHKYHWTSCASKMYYIKLRDIHPCLYTYPYRIGLNTIQYRKYFRSFLCVNIKYIELYFKLVDTPLYIVTIPSDAHVDYDYMTASTNKIIVEKILPLWDIYTLQYLSFIGTNIGQTIGFDDEYNNNIEFYLFSKGIGLIL